MDGVRRGAERGLGRRKLEVDERNVNWTAYADPDNEVDGVDSGSGRASVRLCLKGKAGRGKP